ACSDIVVFPELALTGYPPEDLLLKPKFISDNLTFLKKLSSSVGACAVIAGFVDRKGPAIYNSAAVIQEGKVRAVYHKMLLPNYGVFDEKRYFAPGDKPLVLKFGGSCLGVNICEDVWYLNGPTRTQAQKGAKLILNINASPYYAGRSKEREAAIRRQARLNKIFIAYVNLVGGQDELVFDGQSMIADNKGRIIARAAALKEDLLVTDLLLPVKRSCPGSGGMIKPLAETERPVVKYKPRQELSVLAEVYQALVLGLSDYVRKNGFQKVVIGLSGGIDSSLVAALACDALGQDNVVGVFMPSEFTSEQSKQDARELAEKLGMKLIEIPILQIHSSYLGVLQEHFSGRQKDITEENLQARIRGNLLMALSNKFCWMVLTTGNKSEMSTGYATLYGDMAGGFAVIKDVPKLLVYQLCLYRNSLEEVIPREVLRKAPTAELRPNQKDSDTLPVYEVLDPILKAYIEEDKDFTKIITAGFDQDTVLKVLNMVDRSEYKRRQSPPGIKITPKAFGRDRRMPITNQYKASAYCKKGDS
ncbi:MAG: NAD+ synthase, partial [Candidatus Omnitrophica bacterium]|nr:NAD+ synthase [Candidatus Omnitrophota bacterium]